MISGSYFYVGNKIAKHHHHHNMWGPALSKFDMCVIPKEIYRKSCLSTTAISVVWNTPDSCHRLLFYGNIVWSLCWMELVVR